MAFKKIEKQNTVPDSPEKLFADLPRRKIPDVLPHQKDIMQKYVSEALDSNDVALQLPTGSGKTLVGLLIAEWRRRKYNEKVVYLAPTKQLVNQVVEQAREKYGITVNGFTGSQRSYDNSAKSEYKSAEKIAITTYSSLFNSSPYFHDADVIIMDDVHAAESYISDLWSLKLNRHLADEVNIHAAICEIIKPHIEIFNYTRIIGTVEENSLDASWIDKLPTPAFNKIKDDLIALFDSNTKGTDLSYSWSMIREHLDSCHLYMSASEIYIRPVISPTWMHKPFHDAKQRIYMSATLGNGGDLERIVGRYGIKRVSLPDEWNKHGVGRRFFIFPDISLSDDDAGNLKIELLKRTSRSLVLVPNDRIKKDIKSLIDENLGYEIYDSNSIEISKKTFVESTKSVAVVANRYDGIDFPGDDCRLLFIEGLPKATNLQERFLIYKMGANVLYNERIQTRVLQAIGRCTRSLEDYSAVVISGQEFTDYLIDPKRKDYFHPELQAELSFGITQSKDVSIESIVENLNIFLANDEEWESANKDIVAERDSLSQKEFPGIDKLSESVKDEIRYQMSIWQGDYEKAYEYALNVLSCIDSTELKGYKSIWHYLAGSAALKIYDNKEDASYLSLAKEQFNQSKKISPTIPWLVGLSNLVQETSEEEEDNNLILLEQVERIESVLAGLGTSYSKKYHGHILRIRNGLASTSQPQFEEAHKLLGELMGFESGNQETDGSPDPWWINSDMCLVFEDHAGAYDESTLSINKARQVASHPTWIKENLATRETTEILPVLVTPVSDVDKEAMIFLENVSVWKLEEFREWSVQALSCIDEIRLGFAGPGNEEWRLESIQKLKDYKCDALTLIKFLREQKAVTKLNQV